MVMVVLAGPPFVRFTDSSNSCRVPLMDMINVMMIVGLSSGTVMPQKVSHPFAPSIFAASYTEYYIFCNDAR